MDMSSKNDSKWYQNYEALEAYIQERGHLPDKHVVENRALLSWAKYQRKKIKAGTLDTVDIPADSRPPIPVILGHLS